MELFEKLIPLILGMFKFNVNFDINVNEYIKKPQNNTQKMLINNYHNRNKPYTIINI